MYAPVKMDSSVNPNAHFLVLYFVFSILPFVSGILFLIEPDETLLQLGNVSRAGTCQSTRVYSSVSNIIAFVLKLYLLVYYLCREMLQACIADYAKKREAWKTANDHHKLSLFMEFVFFAPFHVELVPYFSLLSNVCVKMTTLLLGFSMLALHLICQVNMIFTVCYWSSTFQNLMVFAGCYEFIMVDFFIVVYSIYSTVMPPLEQKPPVNEPLENTA